MLVAGVNWEFSDGGGERLSSHKRGKKVAREGMGPLVDFYFYFFIEVGWGLRMRGLEL